MKKMCTEIQLLLLASLSRTVLYWSKASVVVIVSVIPRPQTPEIQARGRTSKEMKHVGSEEAANKRLSLSGGDASTMASRR